MKPAPWREEGSATRCPVMLKGMPKFVPTMGMPVSDCDRINAGNGFDLVENLAIEIDDLRRSSEAIDGNGKVKREDVVAAEAEVDASKLPEAVNDKPGAREEC